MKTTQGIEIFIKMLHLNLKTKISCHPKKSTQVTFCVLPPEYFFLYIYWYCPDGMMVFDKDP